MHVTCSLAAAEWLASEEVRENQSGTPVVVFQPNQEHREGARAMKDAGLYQKVPVLGIVLAQCVMPLRAGTVAVRGNNDCCGGRFRSQTFWKKWTWKHAAVMCGTGRFWLQVSCCDWKAFVAREVNPQELAIITVGSIQAEQTEDVMADEAILKIGTRIQRDETRTKLLEAMRRIMKR